MALSGNGGDGDNGITVTSVSSVCLSEHELQPELNDARIASHWNGACNLAEVGTVGGDPVVAWRRARNVEVHLVEDVEELHTELNVHRAAVPEVLEQAHIPALE